MRNPSFVVNVTLTKSNGQMTSKTVPAESYEDATDIAASFNRNKLNAKIGGSKRSAEVCVAVLLHNRTILLPFKSLPDIQDAIAIVLEEETRPPAASTAKPIGGGMKY